MQNDDGSFTLTTPDQTQLNFATTGANSATFLISTIVDRNGNTTTFSYDGNYHLTEVADSYDHSLYFSYGDRTDGQPVTIFQQNPSTGRETQLTYYSDSDPNPGRLQSIVDPAGDTLQFAYDDNHNLTQITDPRGNVAVVYTYTTDGRKASETWYSQRQKTYSYEGSCISVKGFQKISFECENGHPKEATGINPPALLLVT